MSPETAGDDGPPRDPATPGEQPRIGPQQAGQHSADSPEQSGAQQAAAGADSPEGSGGSGGDDPSADGDTVGTPDSGPDAERDQPAGRKGGKQRSFWKELPILIGVALLLALLIKTFLLQAFSIPSDSMQNTLQRGDRVLVDKLTPWFGATPDRGEVVVFRDPGGWLPAAPENGGLWSHVQEGLSFVGVMPSAEDQNLIKRVIAVGGDTVECQAGGPVMVNGSAVPEEDFIFPGNTACDDRPFGPLEVPEGSLWVLGDHRQESQDSRYHMVGPGGGTVAESEVVGRALVVAWPVNRWSFLSVPDGYSGINSAIATTAPVAVGLAGALPLVFWRRRVLLRREA